MAKKIVRGITDVKTINNQDFDTNNVNDLLSDGQYNYIHRKKGKTEEYHNLTDNIKTISSDNTELLSVTNNNKTTNTATLHPKHDKQKEQLLESTRNTISIHHGTNGTPEKTTVDTNPKKVLEHEKLKTGDGLTTSFNTDETTIMFKATKKTPETNLNTLGEGIIYGKGFSIDQVPGGDQDTSAAYVTINISENRKVQFYIREQTNDYGVIRLYYRFIINGEVTEWRKMPGDRSDLNYELAQKEQVLESTRNTIAINHGTNGTDEKTTVDTNPQKVLEHDNLFTDNGISKSTTGNTTKLGVVYTRVQGGRFDLNNLVNGKVRANDFVNAPATGWFFVSGYTEGDYAIQRATSLDHDNNKVWVRCKRSGTWGAWREQVGDKSVIDATINQLTARVTALEEKVAQLQGGGGGN